MKKNFNIVKKENERAARLKKIMGTFKKHLPDLGKEDHRN